MKNIEKVFVQRHLPKRQVETNKNNYGRVIAICGCKGYTGAAYFAAQGAVRMGSGVMTLAVPEAIYPILASKLNEPVIRPIPCDFDGKFCLKSKETLEKLIKHADAVLLGCGIGQSPELEELVCSLVQGISCPMVLDADGINLLQGHIDILQKAKAPLVLTPHKGEFTRLSGVLKEEADEKVQEFAQKIGCTILLKSHRTIITASDGRQMRNQTGNPGMAKGGSGDVLAGMILSLLGQGLSEFDAACVGAWLHGAAGDFCAQVYGEYGMTPTDMLHAIPKVTRRVLGY